MKLSWSPWPFTAAVVGIASVGCSAGNRAPASSPSQAANVWDRPGLESAIRPEMGRPQSGDAAPDFELPVASGGKMRLRSLRGSWVLVHFTATWCPFCDAEVVHLGELADAYSARGVRVLLIDVKEDPEHFIAYARDNVPAAVVPLYDVSGETASRYAPPHAQPSFTDRAQVMFDSTLIVDPEGVIRLFLFSNSARFDPTFRGIRGELERLVGSASPPVAVSVSAPETVHRGSETTLVVQATIRPGYHIMSNRTSSPYYIPTAIRVDPIDAIDTEPASYPPSIGFDLGESTIATYQGQFDVTVPIRVAAGASLGARVMRGSVRIQACTSSTCLAPVSLPFQTKLQVE